MKQEEKQLLLKDICARLPYGVIVHAGEINIAGKLIDINIPYNIVSIRIDVQSGEYTPVPISDVKPYLCPMSSMTREEQAYYSYYHSRLRDGVLGSTGEYLNWLNTNHFDYNGLIPMGLALEAPKDMYKTE